MEPEPGPFVDDLRQNLSLDEAQRLTPFTICLPAYLPAAVDPSLSVDWLAEWDHPEWPEVRLRYYAEDGQELIIDVHQDYAPTDYAPVLSDSLAHAGQYHLVAWLVTDWAARLQGKADWEGDERRRDQLREQATTQSQMVESPDGEEYIVHEVLEPAAFRSVLVEWKRKPVYYWIFARLGVDRAVMVADSLQRCDGSPKRSAVTP